MLHRDGSPYFLQHMGVEICVDPRVFSEKMITTIMRGTYEKKEAKQILSLLEPEETVLEIGAGCGFLSTLMAQHPNCREVHAFEGNPELIPIIKATHLKNKVDVILYNEVLGDFNDEVEFFLNDDFWASGLSKALGNRSVMVKQVAFQSRLNEIRPTLIVCDIEGGEGNLFGDVDLQCTTRLLIELHEDIIGPNGVRTVFDEMSKRGFHYNCSHSSGRVVTFSRPKKTPSKC